MQLDLFNEPLCDYCFLIGPDLSTTEAVKQLKQLLHDQIVLSWANLNSKPHLTLTEFQAYESNEELIVRKMTAVLAAHSAFPVTLDGVRVFEHGKSARSVVLKIADPRPIRELQAALRKALDLRRQKLTPHMTIARNIPAGNFSKLTSLEDFDYKGAFVCDHILLLKKPAPGKSAYAVVADVMLKQETNATLPPP